MRAVSMVILAMGSSLLAGCVMTPPNCEYVTSTQRMRCLQDRDQVERENRDRARARKAEAGN
jgi:hypothetical protein